MRSGNQGRGAVALAPPRADEGAPAAEPVDGLSMIVPAFDEESRLPRTLDELIRVLPTLARASEILVVDDGSRDRTAAVAEERAASSPIPLRVLRLGRNRGKGAAVGHGIAAARFDLVAFTDADCPYLLESLAAPLAELAAGRAQVAIGARDLPESGINRGYGLARRISGQACSWLTGAAIGLPFRDSQCGLKAFRSEVARGLFELRTVEGFGFDFEILAAAVSNGLRVHRFPVRLTHDDDSRVDVVADSLRALRDLGRVRANLRRGAYRLPALPAEARPCPLCAGTELVTRVAQDGFRMVECGGCGLWYLNPMPLDAALLGFYRDDYFRSASPTTRGYAAYETMAEDLRATFRDRLELVRAHVGHGRLLDVGAGYGFLADAARPLFEERWTVEASESAAGRIDAGHRVVVGAWPEAEVPARYFDVVSMQDFLEHLPRPGAALQRAREVLRPGGALLVVTPDTGSWLARAQGRSWVSLKFPEHVVLYSRRTLRRALEEAGFRVEGMVPAGQFVRLDFVAARLAPRSRRLGRFLETAMRALGGANRRLWVPSGSIAAVATTAG